MNYISGKPPKDLDVLWRCEANRYSYTVDAEREEYGITNSRLEMYWYPVTKRTPKGAWITGRFVLLSANKRYACNTEAEAIESFRARKKRQIKILNTQLRRAIADLALAEPSMFGLSV